LIDAFLIDTLLIDAFLIDELLGRPIRSRVQAPRCLQLPRPANVSRFPRSQPHSCCARDAGEGMGCGHELLHADQRSCTITVRLAAPGRDQGAAGGCINRSKYTARNLPSAPSCSSPVAPGAHVLSNRYRTKVALGARRGLGAPRVTLALWPFFLPQLRRTGFISVSFSLYTHTPNLQVSFVPLHTHTHRVVHCVRTVCDLRHTTRDTRCTGAAAAARSAISPISAQRSALRAQSSELQRFLGLSTKF
jgi:hypothetical protein